MLFQEICHGFGLMKFSFRQWRSAVEIGGVDVSAVRDQQFGSGTLVRVRGCMQWRCTPMVILVVGVNFCAATQQQLDHTLVTLPGGAVKWASIHLSLWQRQAWHPDRGVLLPSRLHPTSPP
jgi:hypothetical protein